MTDWLPISLFNVDLHVEYRASYHSLSNQLAMMCCLCYTSALDVLVVTRAADFND